MSFVVLVRAISIFKFSNVRWKAVGFEISQQNKLKPDEGEQAYRILKSYIIFIQEGSVS